MRNVGLGLSFIAASFVLCSCSSMSTDMPSGEMMTSSNTYTDYSSRLAQHIDTSEKVVVVDPHEHAWGAYENGNLVKAGLATSGSDWCPDLGRPCHTQVGSFRVQSLGEADCKSHTFPIPRGGSPMPYCMYFNNGQALHGVPDGEVVEGNISHGCVRMHVADAEWLRFNFVNHGTRVIVKPY